MANFARMKEILSKYADKGINLAEKKMFSPDLRGINALAASFSLLVMADRVAEDAEKEAVSEYLIDLDVVIQKGLMREVSELFLQHIQQLETANKKGGIEFNIVVGEILNTISEVKDDVEWSAVVAETVQLVTSGNSTERGEVVTRNRILKTLGRQHS